MLNYVIFGASFISIWLVAIWLNCLYYRREKPLVLEGELPTVAIAIPFFNESKGSIEKTLSSLARLEYPKDKIEMFVVNDGSTNGCEKHVHNFMASHTGCKINLINQQNMGKAAALNTALAKSKAKMFCCLDADTRVQPDSLKKLLPHFSNKKVGAVISAIKVDDPSGIYQRMQRVEYIMSSFIRRMMCLLGTLFVTHGALSMFDSANLKKIGGFTKDRNNLTEDLEIAFRILSKGKSVKMEPSCVSHTTVPSSFSQLWHQRIRWARGYVHNHWNYRSFLFSKKQALLGIFQFPMNLLSVVLLITVLSTAGYGIVTNLWRLVFRSITIQGYFVNHVLVFPNIKQFLLSINIPIMLPVLVVTVLGVYVVYTAHRFFNEGFFRNVGDIIAYLIIMPYLSLLHWIFALGKEITRAKKRWK